MTAPVVVRPARAGDAAAVAHLHASSWQAHYRGSFSDAYLDGPVVAERQAVWSERLTHSRPAMIVLVAEQEQVLRGFVCVLADHDPQFGSLVDNLHVAGADQGRGLGRRLLGDAGRALQHALPRRPVYLFVLAANTAAQRFYDRVGGRRSDQARKTEPDGSTVLVERYAWDSPATLVAGCRT